MANSSLQTHLHYYWIAQSFLTRLPVPPSKQFADKAVGRSLLYYPAVGLLIGCILSLLAWLFANSSALLAAVIICTAWVLITGALHLDGLADSADAWLGGHGNKERIFSIMKDPRSGTAGVAAIVLLLMLKVAALATLIEQSSWGTLFFAPILARWSVLALLLFLPSAKPEGIAYLMKQNLPFDHSFAVLISLGIILFFLSPWALIITIISLLLLNYMMMKQIAGITGDTLGASIEIVEAMVLVLISV